MFDFHLHTRISYDTNAVPEEMVQSALDRGLKEICFTDHFDDDPAGGIPQRHFDIADYNAAYDHLEAEGLKIRKGFETGLIPDNQKSLREQIAKRRFDFVLGSLHYADGKDAYEAEFWEGKTVHEGERKYLEDTLTCITVHDNFDVLAHLTYVSKGGGHPNRRLVPYEDHKEVIDEIFRTLAQKGKGLELNSSGLYRCGDYLPSPDYFVRFKELGGRIVTVGSDSHSPGGVGKYAKDSCRILKEIFGYVCTYEDRNPVFHRL